MEIVQETDSYRILRRSGDGVEFAQVLRDGKWSRRARITPLAKGGLSLSYRRMLQEQNLPIPSGWRVVSTSGGRTKFMKDKPKKETKTKPKPPEDKIVLRKLTPAIAKEYGFKNKKAMVDFLGVRAEMGKPIATFSELKTSDRKTLKSLTKKVAKSLQQVIRERLSDIELRKKIKMNKRKEVPNLRLRTNYFTLDLENIDTQFLPNLNRVFQYMVDETVRKEGLQGNDRIQIRIESEEFHQGGLATGYYPVNNDYQAIAHASETVSSAVQSMQSIGSATVSVSSVNVPSGMGINKPVLHDERMSKRCGVFPLDVEAYCGFISLAMTRPINRLLNFGETLYKANRDKARFRAGQELMNRCGIAPDQQVADWTDFQNIAEQLKVCIHIFDIQQRNWLKTSNVEDVPNDDAHHVYLIKDMNHFNPIDKPKVWFNKKHICHICEHGFDKTHKCKVAQKQDPNQNYRKIEHKNCSMCKRENDGTYHRCCPNCLTDISKNGHQHKCFMSKGKVMVLDPEQATENATLLRVEPDGRHIYDVKCLKVSDKYLYFDFEAMTLPDGSHKINLCIIHDFYGNEFIFNSLDETMRFFLQRDEEGKFVYKDYTVIAHYGSGYDFKFCYEWLLVNSNLNPFTIFNGQKITYMQIPGIKMRFVDSFKFFLQPLETLPTMFGLKELKKGFFPHTFNTPDNQAYVGRYPDKSFYCHNDMKTEKRNDFIKWWLSNKLMKETFDFHKELVEYCRSDVDILRRACLALRNLFMENENIDPFQYTTLPGATLALFRANHMPENSIGIFDLASDNQSNVAIEWLEYRKVADNKHISTANDGREAWIKVNTDRGQRSVKVDGLCENDVYEFSGCFHHGCPKCFPRFKDKLESTNKKNEMIQNEGYMLHHIWQCEWEDMKQTEQVRENLEKANLVSRINPREAFFGGRTDALKTFFDTRKAPMDCKIDYKDITSLYPWVNYTKEYPKGHPDIIRKDFDYSLQSYFGIVKCKVQPPRGLYHPVLPRKIDGKLVFDLGGVENNPFIGTWTTLEINKAVEKGYKILDIYEVHHFKERTTSIFKSYVARFLKIKQEASGFPSHVKTEEDKDKYIKEYYENQGILLDKENIKSNKGLRAFAKLCLNNLWGRFGMRTFNDKQEIVRSHNDVLNVLTNKNVIPSSINFSLFDDIPQALASYETAEADRNSMYTTNIYIAIFTTSWARLALYDALDFLGDRVIYMDTDSVIYYYENEEQQIKTGDYLGDFTDEIDGHFIERWVSGGAKNYGYVLAKNKDCPKGCKHCGKAECKVKGFSLTHGNKKHINFENIVVAVRRACLDDNAFKVEYDNLDEMKITANNFRIRYDMKTRKMISKTEEKDWSYQVDKRQLKTVNNWMIDYVPYGY